MDYIETAVAAARAAGRIHLKHFRSGIGYETKSSSYDLLTAADIEGEEAVVSLIQARHPGHNILAEEGRYESTSSEYTWVIDPLDGTNNFASGLPIFCVSIALLRGDDVVLGVVYDPTRDELFRAESARGAYLNDRRLQVSAVDELSGALLITGFYYDRGESMNRTLREIRVFFDQRILGLRRLGAAALDLCYVAAGRAGGFWEFELSPWDFAAGKLIVEEAGGRISDKAGGPVRVREKSFVVASNGRIHQKMLDILNGE